MVEDCPAGGAILFNNLVFHGSGAADNLPQGAKEMACRWIRQGCVISLVPAQTAATWSVC